MLCIPLLPLESELLVKVDAKDFWWIADFDWYCLAGYAARSESGRLVYMHRQIMGEECERVDHINGVKLDNRRRNLRSCSASQNRQNSRKQRHRRGQPTSSQYKGVSAVPAGWEAQGVLPNCGGQKHLGIFLAEIEAAQAYDEFARSTYGEFARLNFPAGHEQPALIIS